MPGIRQATPLPFSPPIQHQIQILTALGHVSWQRTAEAPVSGGPFDQYVTRQTSKPVIVSKMGRTIISTAETGRPGCALRQGKPGRVYSA